MLPFMASCSVAPRRWRCLRPPLHNRLFVVPLEQSDSEAEYRSGSSYKAATPCFSASFQDVMQDVSSSAERCRLACKGCRQRMFLSLYLTES